MKRLPALVVILILLPSGISGQGLNSSSVLLSPKGRVAYNKLLSACIFRVGGVGYSGETSKDELALYDLLEEKESVAALKNLVNVGTFEGGLYGLLGLSL